MIKVAGSAAPIPQQTANGFQQPPPTATSVPPMVFSNPAATGELPEVNEPEKPIPEGEAKLVSMIIEKWYEAWLVNPLYPNISLQVLRTVLYRSPVVLIRRICSMIKSFLTLQSLPLFSWPKCLIQGNNDRRNKILTTLRGWRVSWACKVDGRWERRTGLALPWGWGKASHSVHC